MKMFWRQKEDVEKTRNEFDADQKEAIWSYIFISFVCGMVYVVINQMIAEFLGLHLRWIP